MVGESVPPLHSAVIGEPGRLSRRFALSQHLRNSSLLGQICGTRIAPQGRDGRRDMQNECPLCVRSGSAVNSGFGSATLGRNAYLQSADSGSWLEASDSRSPTGLQICDTSQPKRSVAVRGYLVRAKGAESFQPGGSAPGKRETTGIRAESPSHRFGHRPSSPDEWRLQRCGLQPTRFLWRCPRLE